MASGIHGSEPTVVSDAEAADAICGTVAPSTPVRAAATPVTTRARIGVRVISVMFSSPDRGRIGRPAAQRHEQPPRSDRAERRIARSAETTVNDHRQLLI